MNTAKRPTLDDIKHWPATVKVEQAATALGISRAHLYELVSIGEAPVLVLPLGNRKVVVTSSIIRLLEGR